MTFYFVVLILKQEWKQHVKAKSNYQKYEKQIKKDHKSDCFTENPLLLNDYVESVEKDKIIKKDLADLRQELLETDKLKKHLICMLNKTNG